MKYKVSELDGELLDNAVAIALGWSLKESKDWKNVFEWYRGDGFPWVMQHEWMPSSSWEDAGPIIESERIDIQAPILQCELGWLAAVGCADPMHFGPTPMIAAMRAFVASKFGEEVEL